MKLLANFDQAKEARAKGQLEYQRQMGCCLACCVEWGRLILGRFKTMDGLEALSRMEILRARFANIVTAQDLYVNMNTMFSPKSSASPREHQERMSYLVNTLGSTKDEKDAIQSLAASFQGEKLHCEKNYTVEVWKRICDGITTAGSCSLLLIKGAKDGQKWHHAVASAAFVVDGKKILVLFDPNGGEYLLEAKELKQAIDDVIQRCETGAKLHTLRTIQLSPGSGPQLTI